MGHRRADVVAQALDVLDRYGLADLTMRRLASELGVQPSALYHHFPSKQHLLAAVAEEILRRGRRGRAAGVGAGPEGWEGRVAEICVGLREALLAYRDGAEVVATVRAFGLGADAPEDELVEALAEGGLDAVVAPVAARTLLHFVFGHVVDEQTHLQAGSAGAIDAPPREASDFAVGLGLLLDGIRGRTASPI